MSKIFLVAALLLQCVKANELEYDCKNRTGGAAKSGCPKTTACRKSHYVEDGRRRLCMCDGDCNHENNFCAEGLTCSTLGVCQDKSSQTDCTIIWLMHPPHIVAVLVIVMVVVCVCLRCYPRLFKAQNAGSGDHIAGRVVINNTTNGYVPSRVDVHIPVARLVGEIELENARHAFPSSSYTTKKVPAVDS